MQAWKLGVKALAIYRDGSKTAQALRTDAQEDKKTAAAAVVGEEMFTADEVEARVGAAVEAAVSDALVAAKGQVGPARNKMPRERQSITHKFWLGGHEGYITAGMYEDGSVGEIFLTDIGKEGSTLRGMMNSFATAISIALPVRGAAGHRLRASSPTCASSRRGITANPEIPFAKSMPNYVVQRWLALALPGRGHAGGGFRHPHAGGARQEVRRGSRDRRRRRRLAPGQRRRLGGVGGQAPHGLGPGHDAPRPAGGSGADDAGPDLGDDGHPARRPRAPDGPGPRPGLPAVRRDDAAHGLVLHVLELRQQHGLRLI